MEMTRRQMSNSPPGQNTRPRTAERVCTRPSVRDRGFRDVVRPNFDSLYSMTWLDLSDGPVMVSVPDTDGRYYVLPMYDMWTDAFAAPGWRTSGTRGAAWGVVRRGGPERSGWRVHHPRPALHDLDHRPHADERTGRLRGGQQDAGRDHNRHRGDLAGAADMQVGGWRNTYGNRVWCSALSRERGDLLAQAGADPGHLRL
jgi:hypothetical protein